MTRRSDRPAPHLQAPRRQRGIAAIEFALVFMLLFVFLYGITTFGAVFYTQQVITRAAEDGARAIAMYNNPTEIQIRELVLDSLGAPIKDTPGLLVTSPVGANPVVVTVTYPYRANALVPPLPFTATWMPETLRGRAAAARPPVS